MKITIPIDEYTQIVIDSENYILQYRRKSKKRISWRKTGNFPDLTSLATEYLNSAPRRDENAIKSLDGIVVAIKKAESKICKIIVNFQKNERNQR